MVKPTTTESDANSGKEGASSDKNPLPQGRNRTGIHAAVAPPPSYGGPVHAPHINHLGPPPKLVLNDFPNCVFISSLI